MGLYERVRGKEPEEEPEGEQNEEFFNPVELEQAFDRPYRSYRINGRSRIDVDTFFDRIRQNLIDLISRELTDLNSARVQMTIWIRYRLEYKDRIIDRVRLPFNSRMTDIFQCSDLNEIINEMFAHIKTQIENPALANSRFRFDEVLFLDINFHQLNLTRGSSYLPQPDWVSRKGRVISPKNESDEECFKWAVIAPLHYVDIKSHPERILNLKRFKDYDWGGLKFPLSIKRISKFDKENDVSVNVLDVEEKKVYILRRSNYESGKKVVNLLLIDKGEQRHYTAIKSLSRLLKSNYTKYKCKQHFCMNFLQGSPLKSAEISTSNIVKTTKE